jgi:uncharacterized protein
VELEKNLRFACSKEALWALLLDPEVMTACVPGMKSLVVESPTQYRSEVHVKIAFVSAKFKINTRITEQDMPNFLCAEGTGDDASAASSFKQVSRMWLIPALEGGTDLKIHVKVDLLGKLGSFGLTMMKTKADRIWEEFGENLAAHIASHER